MLFNDRLGRIAMRTLAGIVALGAIATLASCGGGTYQVSTFQPARILVFGDESSRLEGPQALKYSINGIDPGARTLDCAQYPIWTQYVASSYGLVFANCNKDASFNTSAIDLTVVNGNTNDIVNKVTAFQAGDTFNSNDLVLIWVGQHDVLNEYQTNGSGDQGQLLADMKAAGTTLGNLVNTIANAGARVVILTIPDMSYTPYAFTESQKGDFDRSKLISQMSSNFNQGMRGTILNDGSKIALVEADAYVRNATLSGSGLVTPTEQTYGCLDSAPLPTCTPDTLRDDPLTHQAASSAFMWADPTHLGNVLQGQIGTRAQQLAHSNPF